MPGTTPTASTPSVVSAASMALLRVEPVDAHHDVELDQRKAAVDEQRRQRHHGQPRNQRREEQQEQDQRDGGDEAGHLGLAARRIVDGGAGLAAGDREALEQPGEHVSDAERGEFLVGVDFVAVLGGERARQQDALGVGQQGNADRRRQQGVDVPPISDRQGEAGQPARKRADHGHAAAFQVRAPARRR